MSGTINGAVRVAVRTSAAQPVAALRSDAERFAAQPPWMRRTNVAGLPTVATTSGEKTVTEGSVQIGGTTSAACVWTDAGSS